MIIQAGDLNVILDTGTNPARSSNAWSRTAGGIIRLMARCRI
jgi:hypothetical protein